LHYIIEFPFLLFKIFLGGLFGASIGFMPFVLLDRAINGEDQTTGFGKIILIVGLIVGIAGLVIGVYLSAKSGFAKYKRGLGPLD
jgi:hypothetical protein